MAGLQLNPKTGTYDMTYDAPGYGQGRPAPAPQPAGLFTSAYQAGMNPQSAPDINSRREQDYGTGAMGKGMQTLEDYNYLEGASYATGGSLPEADVTDEISATEWDALQNTSASGQEGAMSMQNMQAIKAVLDQTASASTQEGVGPATKIAGGVGTAGGGALAGILSGGNPAAIAAGAAIGGALGAGVGSLLDFIALADSKNTEELEARQRAAKIAQFEQMSKQKNAIAQTQADRDAAIAKTAATQTKMRDMLGAYIGRKMAKATRKGLIAPGAPVQPYNTTSYRAGLAKGMF